MSDALVIGDVARDWATFYAELEQAGSIPFAESQSIDSGIAAFRAMVLDASHIAAAVSAATVPPALVEIYADVLVIPENFTWELGKTGLVVWARRIEAAAGAGFTIDFSGSGTAGLLLYTAEVAGTLTLRDGGSAWSTAIAAPPESGGVQVAMQAGAPALRDRTWANGWPFQASLAVTDYIQTEFIFASLLFDQDPALALAIFTWVKNWASASPSMLDELLRSASMIALLSQQMNAEANGAAFVPYLTDVVYTSLASAYVAEAGVYENNYLALSTQQVMTKENIELANTLLDNQTAQSNYVVQLLAQAKSNFDNAVGAVGIAQVRFAEAQRAAKLTQIDFEDEGVPEWKRQKILDAVISLGTAIVTFAVGIAGMMGGDEAAGAASAESAVSSAKAVEAAAKAGSDIAATASKLADVMKQLKLAAKALKQVYDLSTAVIGAAQDIANAETHAADLAKMNIATGGIDLTALAGWQVYQLNADDAMATPVSEGIGYADELKLAIDTIAIYGQALAAAQIAAVQAGQRYAQVQLQLALAEQQQQRLAAYVDGLTVDDATISTMMLLFYRRYIDIKSALFTAAEEYRSSYFYWALEASQTRPRIVDKVSDLGAGLSDLTAIAMDQEQALQHFPMPPQPIQQLLVQIVDQAVLTSLKATGTASWVIPLDHSSFQGMDRVRLGRVRIWLENAVGAAEPYGVNLEMATNGSYQDRLDGVVYQFVAQPLARAFDYEVTLHPQGGADWTFSAPAGASGKVKVDGAVDALVSYAYFEPTPFTQWTIKLAKDSRGLDLSGLTQITMEFAGSVIADA